MKSRMILSALVVAMAASMVSMVAIASTDATGNGAPSGEHFTLNIIGVQKDKSVDMDQAGGSVIFVPLYGTARIELFGPAEDFAVLDKNGTQGSAVFALPDPGLDPYIVGDEGDADTMSDHSVYVRPLGKPGGWSTITTCADLLDSTFGGLLSNDVVKIIKNQAGPFGGYASIEQVGQPITFRDSGRSRLANVTAQLLTVVFQIELYDDYGNYLTTVLLRVPIFDDSIAGEYWAYDNNGLKILQVRFYPGVQTDVSEADVNLMRLP